MLASLLFFADHTPTTQPFLNALADCYYEVTTTTTLKALRLSLRQSKPSAIIIQIGATRNSAYETCRNIRRHPQGKDVPILLCANGLDEVEWGTALVSGADDIISIVPQDIQQSIARLKFLLREYGDIGALQKQMGVILPHELAENNATFERAHKLRPVGTDLKERYPDRGLPFRWDNSANSVLVGAGLTQELDILHLRNTKNGDVLDILCEAGRGTKLHRHLLELGGDDLFYPDRGAAGLAFQLAALRYRKSLKANLQKQLEAQVARANLDPLTGLLNRRAGLALSRAELKGTADKRNPFSAMVIDIDQFKRFNDQFGHAFGDKILRKCAERLKRHIREVDILTRYGGDEFLLCLPNIDLPTATQIAARLRHGLAKPIKDKSGSHRVTVSIGLATASGSNPNLQSLIDQADINMFREKPARKMTPGIPMHFSKSA